MSGKPTKLQVLVNNRITLFISQESYIFVDIIDFKICIKSKIMDNVLFAKQKIIIFQNLLHLV